MFTSLRAVVYRVPDLEAAKQWYGKILGKAPVFDSPIVVVFAVGDATINLTPAGANAPRGTPQAVAYWGVEDIEKARRELVEAGAKAVGEIITTALKSRAATVVDPFGNVFGLAGKLSAAKRSLDEQPSQSALNVALFRAFATRDARPEIRGEDCLAEKFLPEELRTLVDNPAAREWAIAKAPGSYEYFIARTKFFDETVRAALEEQAPQVVFLGAGCDSRAYRFADRIRETRIFELDVPSTQQRKKAMLEKAGIAAPAGLSFVPVNFTRDSLGDVLAKAGFDCGKQTLYVWEGVVYYLTPAAVDETLATIRRISPAGSRVCFDYMIEAPDMESRYGVAQSRGLMKENYCGEPVRFRIPEGTLEAFLDERGYTTEEHLVTADLERRYLKPALKALACFGLVRAAVVG
jgi:methyltransferase (TIGR00027 family)